MEKRTWYLELTIVLIMFCISSCNSDSGKEVSVEVKKDSTKSQCASYNYCFLMKPVKNASSIEEFTADIAAEKPRVLTGLFEQLLKRKYKYDESMSFMTGFNRQKLVFFSYKCLDKLKNPDSSFIAEIFTNSQASTMVSFGTIAFVKSYEKIITNYGKSFVYEYEATGAPTQATQKVYLILHDKPDYPIEDYKGYAFCADGIHWYKTPNQKEESFSMINWVRPNKQYEVLLYFKDDKFIPVGHSKIGEWDY